MEKLLARLAQQLDAIDEASLMSLWSKYATAARRYEPTGRWEESALIFSLIQAKRCKSQLFNYYWARQSRPDAQDPVATPEGLAPDFELEPADVPTAGTTGPHRENARRCRVLAFRPAGDADAVKPQDQNQPH